MLISKAEIGGRKCVPYRSGNQHPVVGTPTQTGSKQSKSQTSASYKEHDEDADRHPDDDACLFVFVLITCWTLGKESVAIVGVSFIGHVHGIEHALDDPVVILSSRWRTDECRSASV